MPPLAAISNTLLGGARVRDIVVAGWGQITQPKDRTQDLLDPLGLMAAAATRAAECANLPLSGLDAILVVRPMSAHYPDAARQLADRLDIAPQLAETSRIGGNSPQSLVNRAAGLIARGELDAALVVGGEAYYRRNRDTSTADSALFQAVPRDDDDLVGTSPIEARHGITEPIHGFPLLETALWAQSGLPIDDYLANLGRRWSRFSEVAACHPHAWFREPRTAESFVAQEPTNRRIAFPYRKFLNPVVTVDMGAAVILTRARRTHPSQRPVFFRGGAYAEDRQRFIVQRDDLTRSVPLGTAVRRALGRAGLSLDEIEAIDLYSCFPSAVAIAHRTLGLRHDDPRPHTLTGGLGSFGGPGNDYSLHAIATLAEAIAAGTHDSGLITAFGWFLHKHAAGVYAAEPGSNDLSSHDMEDAVAPLVGDAPVPVVDRPTGRGTVETYTVLYDRGGAPRTGVVYGRDQQGRRFVAHVAEDHWETMMAECCVGQEVGLGYDPQTGLSRAEF